MKHEENLDVESGLNWSPIASNQRRSDLPFPGRAEGSDRSPVVDDSLGGDTVDAAFADLFDQCQERIQAGEPVDVEALAAQYPAWADQIRELVPAIRGLAEVGQPFSRQALRRRLEIAGQRS
jgi:hypothetical protein